MSEYKTPPTTVQDQLTGLWGHHSRPLPPRMEQPELGSRFPRSEAELAVLRANQVQPILNHQPIVYYATTRLGGAVKIGTTNNITRRMITLTRKHHLVVTVMAWEWGSMPLEARRHGQFEQYRLQGEWFWLVQPIVDHMEGLR